MVPDGDDETEGIRSNTMIMDDMELTMGVDMVDVVDM